MAHFLRSLGQTAIVAGPAQLEVDTPHSELVIYLRVWAVLYPDAEVPCRSIVRLARRS